MSILKFEDINSGDVIKAEYRGKNLMFVVYNYEKSKDKLYAIKYYMDDNKSTICNVEHSIQLGQFDNCEKLMNFLNSKI